MAVNPAATSSPSRRKGREGTPQRPAVGGNERTASQDRTAESVFFEKRILAKQYH